MIDLQPYFVKYEALVASADSAFAKLRDQCPGCVTCNETCADCCFALFDLSLIEALYVNDQFRKRFDDPQRQSLLEKANVADRKIHKIKRQIQQAAKQGIPEQQLFEVLSKERVRCPMLADDMRCEIYPVRPITCRLYGVPLAIGGQAHTCGRSKFVRGEKYPTVKVDIFHQKMYDLSVQLALDIRTRFSGLAQMLVPLSMALLNDYDEQYLGIDAQQQPEGDADS